MTRWKGTAREQTDLRDPVDGSRGTAFRRARGRRRDARSARPAAARARRPQRLLATAAAVGRPGADSAVRRAAGRTGRLFVARDAQRLHRRAAARRHDRRLQHRSARVAAVRRPGTRSPRGHPRIHTRPSGRSGSPRPEHWGAVTARGRAADSVPAARARRRRRRARAGRTVEGRPRAPGRPARRAPRRSLRPSRLGRSTAHAADRRRPHARRRPIGVGPRPGGVCSREHPQSPSRRSSSTTHLELDFAFTLSANARFRVNFYQQRGALGGAFRIIPTEIKTLEMLGVPEVVGQFSQLPRGLVLVTGPTGSGKSTTLAALIDLVNRTRADHIVTVEDPIEFLHTNQRSLVNQREVGHDTKSFANALKHVLRQDPDVILIGELRDLETDLGRADRRRDRPPGLRDPAHAGRRADHRPRHRRVPASPAGPDPLAARRRAAGRGLADSRQTGERPRPGGRDRDPHDDAGHQQPRARGQDLPDRVRDAGRQVSRHAHHGSAPRRARQHRGHLEPGGDGEGTRPRRTQASARRARRNRQGSDPGYRGGM